MKTQPKKIFSLQILGVMTGTSCDGLDLACVRFENQTTAYAPLSLDCLWAKSFPYPPFLRAQVLELQAPNKSHHSLHTLLKLNKDLGKWYAQKVSQAIQKHAQKPDAIANHGQTVFHHPQQGLTLQLGDPTLLAYQTGITTLSHFRNGDLAAGGQGAPLVPLFHSAWLQATHPELRGQGMIHNLGGISNLTCIYASQGRKKQTTLLAFDTGPANLWMDAAVEEITQGKKKMDKGGQMARRGKPDLTAVRRLLTEHPFFRQKPPKATGRDDFPYALFRKATSATGFDLVATATELTVQSITKAYQEGILQNPSIDPSQLKKIFFCGGGALNSFLMNQLSERLTALSSSWTIDLFPQPQWTEAQAFAYLGWKSLQGDSIGGTWTGAKSFGPPALITPGLNWKSLLKKGLVFSFPSH